ncbi:MAG: lytic transglycosylase domain-containing protein [Ignavibacteriales bacterium]|nr:lytic transglycosylase domain-containing protein [Ignavibacteriales bacterium]
MNKFVLYAQHYSCNRWKSRRIISLKTTKLFPQTQNNITIFGEGVPLENFEVYERVDREILVNTYWHSATILAIKRAARWFPVIEPILKQNNIPDDFKYLAVVESNLENVVSPAGATGYWQFIKTAAKQYGLEVNEEVDERYDVQKSTLAACKYLNTAYQMFGNWTMSASSYNAGISGIENGAVYKNQPTIGILFLVQKHRAMFPE